MKIKLSPVRGDEQITLSKLGDVLTINGEEYDFSPIPEGATLPNTAVSCKWVVSDIERVGGELSLTLMLPHGSDAPEETRFPISIITTEDGPIHLPPYENDRTVQDED